MLQSAQEAGIRKIFMPNIDLESIEPMFKLEKENPAWCFSMMGLHPCSVGKDYKEVLEQMKPYFDQKKFVGVGETGIDLYWDKTYLSEQIEALKIQAEWAEEYDLPLVIHVRDSMEVTLNLLEEIKRPGLYGVIHCFTGDEKDAKRAIGANFKLGLGGVLTYKNSGLKNSIKDIPLSEIVLETDSPYLAPVPKRGKRNEPAYVAYVAEHLAQAKEMTVEAVIEETTNTASKLFKNH
jgi:TatD DNase family protein